MAHALRYYKNLTLDNGRRIRIEFHEKDGTAAAMELGDVIQSLNLEIPGGGDVDQPIVKTMLNFTFIDAPDHADHKTKKCGAWEEFYSPDATHWKVLLFYKNNGESSYTQFWGGYITPDSFHESLTYRAGVSFIARDNIGHLQDFPFDAKGNSDGMISLTEILDGAWAKIESPMELEAKTDGDVEWLRCDGTNALFTYMNVSAFEGKNWLEVVEEVLYGYGLVMRYVGENYVYVYPLRNLAIFPYPGSGVDVQFQTGAERELSPAVRRIEESVDYTIEETIARPLANANEYSGAVVDVTIEGKNLFGETITKTAKANPLTRTFGKGWYNPSQDGTLLLNPKAYNTEMVNDYIASDMVFLLNTKNTEVVYSATIVPQNLIIRLAFGNALEILGAQLAPKWFATLSKLRYAISATQSGITQYWDGGTWVAAKTELSATFEGNEVAIECNARKYTDEVTLELHIYSIGYESKISSEDATYAALNSLTFVSAESPALLITNRVNTNYIDTNNVILSRDPQIAPAMNTPFVPAVIKNGIFCKDGATYVAAPLWSWKANGDGAQQMAVYNHLQLLCFHAKPNNILSGTILNADVTNIGKVYRWNGTEHLLVSGTLNLITGYIENATLREFARYEDMWGDLTDTADLPEVDSQSVNNLEGESRTGGNTATYATTTEVNIGGGGNIMLDAFMSDSSTNGVQNKVVKAYIDSNVNTLKGNIEKRALQSDLVTLSRTVQSNSGTLSGVVMDLSTIEQWKNLLSSVLIVKDGNLYCLSNFIVEGDTSSGGDGEDNPSGGITDADLEGYAKEEWVRERFQALITQSNKLSYGLLKDTPVLGTISNKNVDTEGGKFMMTNGGGDVVWVVLDKSRVGLSNVDNTADANKNVLSATKLTTARTLWGNSFDGTQDISGNILLPKGRYLIGGASEEGIYITDNTISWHGTNNMYRKSFLAFSGLDDEHTLNVFSNLSVLKQISAQPNAGMWINGKEVANSAFQCGAQMVTNAFAPVLAVKTVGGHTITYGGIDNRVGFYGYYTDRTQNGTDWHHYFNVGTGELFHSGKATFQQSLTVTQSIFAPTLTSTGGLNITAHTEGVSARLYLTTGTFRPWAADSGNIDLGSTAVQWRSLYAKKAYLDGSTYIQGGSTNPYVCFTLNEKNWYCQAYNDGKSDGIFLGSTSSKSLKVNADGQVYCPKDLIVSGDTASGSDVRFKDIQEDADIQVEDIANAPYFAFKWNDREDNDTHIGTSAQYWEKILPELVNGEDFKTLNYGSLGVGMGIALAKRLLESERRVKALEDELKEIRRMLDEKRK